MSIRSELEAALAKAEAEWRSAKEDWDRATAERERASAAWNAIAADRRHTQAERRRPGAVWDGLVADRRKAGADRRIPRADLAALTQAVAARDQAYTARIKAEDDWAAADAALTNAEAERNRAMAEVEALNRAQGRP